KTLQEQVARDGPLAVEDVYPIARAVAEGLRAAHGKGILHRDVKPANVLVAAAKPQAAAAANRTWNVKLIDFRLALKQPARHAGRDTFRQGKTLVGASIAGTLDYGAPEQLGRIEAPVGRCSDVYGWARTCCFALFGTPQPLPRHFRGVPETLAEL